MTHSSVVVISHHLVTGQKNWRSRCTAYKQCTQGQKNTSKECLVYCHTFVCALFILHGGGFRKKRRSGKKPGRTWNSMNVLCTTTHDKVLLYGGGPFDSQEGSCDGRLSRTQNLSLLYFWCLGLPWICLMDHFNMCASQDFKAEHSSPQNHSAKGEQAAGTSPKPQKNSCHARQEKFHSTLCLNSNHLALCSRPPITFPWNRLNQVNGSALILR